LWSKVLQKYHTHTLILSGFTPGTLAPAINKWTRTRVAIIVPL